MSQEKSTNIHDYIVNTRSSAWNPLIEEGVYTAGISVMPLRFEDGRPPSFLLKFAPGASYPYHNHPGGEELLVLAGSCEIEGAMLHEGDYLYTPPGFRHSVKSETGCTILFIVPEEVEIVERM